MINNKNDYSLIKTLELKKFRCFSKKIIHFNNGTTVLEGNNGVGKTSLLEALYYSCYLRSFRTHSPKEMVYFGAESFFIKIELETKKDDVLFNQQIQIGFEKGKRRVKIDGNPISSYKELMSSLRVISLTEDDMHLIKGAPEQRRLFLDHAQVLDTHEYAHQLSILRQIVLTRNALLKSYSPASYANYQILTEQLWDQSLVVQNHRIDYIAKLEQEINSLVTEYFDNQCLLSMVYEPKKARHATYPLFADQHLSLLDQEIRLGRSCFGAHLDDLIITYNNKGSRTFASRGQQKLIIVLIKIAQIRLLQKTNQSTVIFLLDDYMTDFDDVKGGVILKILQNLNVQLIFTTPTGHGMLSSQKAVFGEGFSAISL